MEYFANAVSSLKHLTSNAVKGFDVGELNADKQGGTSLALVGEETRSRVRRTKHASAKHNPPAELTFLPARGSFATWSQCT